MCISSSTGVFTVFSHTCYPQCVHNVIVSLYEALLTNDAWAWTKQAWQYILFTMVICYMNVWCIIFWLIMLWLWEMQNCIETKPFGGIDDYTKRDLGFRPLLNISILCTLWFNNNIFLNFKWDDQHNNLRGSKILAWMSLYLRCPLLL